MTAPNHAHKPNDHANEHADLRQRLADAVEPVINQPCPRHEPDHIPDADNVRCPTCIDTNSIGPVWPPQAQEIAGKIAEAALAEVQPELDRLRQCAEAAEREADRLDQLLIDERAITADLGRRIRDLKADNTRLHEQLAVEQAAARQMAKFLAHQRQRAKHTAADNAQLRERLAGLTVPGLSTTQIRELLEQHHQNSP